MSEHATDRTPEQHPEVQTLEAGWEEVRGEPFVAMPRRVYEDLARLAAVTERLREALRDERRETVRAILALLRAAADVPVDPDALVPTCNGYSCWFTDTDDTNTAPLSVDEIVERVGRRAAPDSPPSDTEQP